jgi:cell division protease FtsH
LGRDISRDKNYSDAIAYAIDKEAGTYMENCYKKAREILETNINKLHKLAECLIEQETINGIEFEEIITAV